MCSCFASILYRIKRRPPCQLSAQCMESPVPILVGYLAQYIIKPALGVLIAKV